MDNPTPRNAKERFSGSFDDTSSLTGTEDDDDLDDIKKKEIQKELIIACREKWQLDTMEEPILTQEENALPPALRARIVIIKKCKMANCYNFYSVEFLQSLLSPPDRSVTYYYGTAIASHVIGPEEFYINWVSDVDKIYLLTTWLTAETLDTDISEPIKSTKRLVGTMVAALYVPFGRFHRARILSLGDDGKTIKIFYVDHGLTTDIDLCKVRALPAQLAKIPDYAIRCKLAQVHFTKENVADEPTRTEFLFVLEKPGEMLQCKLTKYYRKSNTFAAKVKVIDSFGDPMVLNEVVEEKYKRRDQINKLIQDAQVSERY